MNRFKLVAFLILSSIVGILFFQNQQLLTLKLFCPEPTSKACFLLSPEFSLAAWMGIFAIAGILSSLFGQLLNQAMLTKTTANKNVTNKTAEKSSSQAKFQRNKAKSSDSSNTTRNTKRPEVKPSFQNPATTDWENRSSENWEENSPSDTNKQPPKDKTAPQVTKTKSEKQAKQAKQTNSDSVYSYKFAESAKNKPPASTKNKTDDIYDASYRTINNSSPKDVTPKEEDNEEWI